MPTRKRNEYLDAESSDEDQKSGYDSGAVEEVVFSRTTQHGRKRQKISTVSAFSSADDDEDSSSEALPIKPSNIALKIAQSPPSSESQNPASAPSLSPTPPPKSTPSKPLPTTTSPTPAHKPGVIYLSRIPPFMRPATLRRLLSPHGIITRLFLTPEAHSTYLARRAQGGNKKHSFTDGWVEFARRRHAKACADAINATTMGGHGWYADDVWNARYLRGFAWADLMGGVRAEEREREERIRVGLHREGRERREFLRAVESGRVQARRRAKNKIAENATGEAEGGAEATDARVAPAEDGGKETEKENENEKEKRKRTFERRFRQNAPRIRDGDGDADGGRVEQSEDAKRVLSKIF